MQFNDILRYPKNDIYTCGLCSCPIAKYRSRDLNHHRSELFENYLIYALILIHNDIFHLAIFRSSLKIFL